jgi:uncharacterized membrane protein
MSKAKKNHSKDKNAAKKAIVLGTENKNRTPLIITIAAVVVIAGGLIVYNVLSPKDTSNLTQSTPKAATTDTVITYAASDFADGTARHFQHTEGNITIKYFILKSSDGVIRAAFDACDVCWPTGKGYYQDGDVMVCRNCGRRFASIHVNEVSGGCNPAPLSRKIEADKVIIKVKDILSGKHYFNFT